MSSFKIVEGNVITMAKEGLFDVTTHGCNCFCSMGSGIAPQMAKAFDCDKYPLEEDKVGYFNKLGQIEFGVYIVESTSELEHLKTGSNLIYTIKNRIYERTVLT